MYILFVNISSKLLICEEPSADMTQDIKREKQIITSFILSYLYSDCYRLHKIRETTKKWAAAEKVSAPSYFHIFKVKSFNYKYQYKKDKGFQKGSSESNI